MNDAGKTLKELGQLYEFYKELAKYKIKKKGGEPTTKSTGRQ